MLGGGGFTGGVYEIGALRALDLLAVNRTVNEFDVYVGTSAGSFVAALAANGVTPEEMMRVVNQQVPTPFRDIDLGTLLRPNYLDFAKSAALLPLRVVRAGAHVGSNLRPVSMMDLVVGLAEGLPPASTTAAASRATCSDVLGDLDRTNDFRLLSSELYLAGHGPRHLRARRARRGRLGRRADPDRGGGVHRAADGLQAGGGEGPRTSWTAACAPPRTWTSRWSTAPSSWW